ncbi:putative glutamine amidotransferase [Deinobacterium chartae]|uniref:Putative glutamine amidotransferase n=1 Tax=Deinobacterium chartae TaxID=521158 RepID=A0A841HZQ2_9DEIO|nr:putative glutamine amidotransferase [Deinobacterium chartae]
MKPAPRIGISVSQPSEPALGRLFNGTSRRYAEAVARAGGLPVFLPVLPGTAAAHVHYLDGLLLSGGVDVDPYLYGEAPRRGLGEVDFERDAFERELYAAAREAAVPVLGICRGMQLINVLEGGTLCQHLPDHPEYWADHAQVARPPALAHEVTLRPGTQLFARHGQTLRVNSHHHQGVKDLAPTLVASATAPDGLIEAFEAPGLLAVQWHPELLFENHPEHLMPFETLVALAREAARV